MKIVKRFLPAFLFVLVLLLAGCSPMGKSDVKEVITRELDLLKNLDSEKTQEYVSYKELFPAAKDMELSAEVKEVFSLFFRNLFHTLIRYMHFQMIGLFFMRKSSARLRVRIHIRQIRLDIVNWCLVHHIYS